MDLEEVSKKLSAAGQLAQAGLAIGSGVAAVAQGSGDAKMATVGDHLQMRIRELESQLASVKAAYEAAGPILQLGIDAWYALRRHL